MNSGETPYEAPPSVNSEFSVANGRSHAWQDRSFNVSTSASGAVFWLYHVIIVSIDGSGIHQQRAVYSGQNFRFTFEHNERKVEAQVRQKRAFSTRFINYELIVDGETIAKSRAPVGNWMRGIAVVLAVILIIFGCFYSFLVSR